MAVEAKEFRTCDVCGKERTEVTFMPRGHYQDGWSCLDFKGSKTEIGPACTRKLLKKMPELAKAVAQPKSKYGADGDCG